MSDYFIFDGVNTTTYGITVFPLINDSAPERVYERYEIAGRNGVLLKDMGRYANTAQAYVCLFPDTSGMMTNFRTFRALLSSKIGYKRLSDTFNSDEYYLAVYNPNEDGFVPIMAKGRNMIRVDVNFERDPRRFLTSGETATNFTASGSISNPTEYGANPLLRVYGTGTLVVNGTGISISNNPNYTDIDCEAKTCSYGTTNRSRYVEFENLEFPYLKSGSNTITLNTGITKVIITPRWYRL